MGPAIRSAILTCCIALAALAAMPASAREKRCDARSAVATPIEAIQSDYTAWAGKCVKLSGIGFGWKIYADRMALTQEPPTSWDNAPRATAVKPRSGLRRGRTPQQIEVIGRVGSCAADNEVAESDRTRGDLFMVFGYCQISRANYVTPSAIRVIDKTPVPRLTEVDVPPDQRSLVSAPAALRDLAESQALAREMMRALLDGDEDRYVRLSEPALIEDLDRKGLKPDWLRIRLRDIRADYVPARQLVRAQAGALSATAPLTSFITRSDLAVTEGRPSLIHCWCKTTDCTGRWPVTPFDADNRRERPYICIATNDYLLGMQQKTILQASLPLETEGFAEPGEK